MYVLRQKRDGKAMNVSYSEVGCLYTTDTSGKYVAFKNASITYTGENFITVEGDTTLNNDYYLEKFTPKVFFTDADRQKMEILLKDEKKKRNKRTQTYELKDLKRALLLQKAELACSIKARRLNYPTKNT